jgi:chromosome segregation ATPase
VEAEKSYHKGEAERNKAAVETLNANLKALRDELLLMQKKHHSLELEKMSWESAKNRALESSVDESIHTTLHKIENERAEGIIDRLKQELEEGRFQLTSNRDTIFKYNEEINNLRSSHKIRDEEQREAYRRLERESTERMEQMKAKYEGLLQDEREARLEVERGLVASQKSLAIAEADLDTYIGVVRGESDRMRSPPATRHTSSG